MFRSLLEEMVARAEASRDLGAAAPRPSGCARSTTGASCPSPRWRSCPSRATACSPRPAPRSASPDGGVADFGSDDFLEPLAVLLPALEHEAELTVIGRWMTRRFLLRFLEVRLQLARVRARRPRRRRRGDPRAVVRHRRAAHRHDDPARAAGAGPRRRACPRGGSCCARCRRRAPTRPSSPPTPASRSPTVSCASPGRSPASSTPSTCTAAACTRSACRRCRSPSARRSSPPAYHVPSYVEWYERCDLRPAYDAHRLVLQVLQRRFRNVHWVLKSPVHLSALPDAVRGVPRRAARDHPPRPAHRARVAHQPGGHAAMGAQRPRRLRRHRPLPRAHVDRARSTVS